MKDIVHQNELESFSLVVDHIYQGATNPNAWATIPEKIAQWLGSKTCLIFTPQFSADTGGFAANHQFNLLELWESKYRDQNIWEARAIERGLIKTGAVMRDQDLLTKEEFENSVIYKELLSKSDIGRMLAGVVFSPMDNDGKLVVCAAHQSLDNPFSEAQANRHNLLMPHLSRALGVMFKLRDAEFRVATSLDALNKIPNGILLFNAKGEVTFANLEAERLLANHQRVSLKTDKDGKTRYLVASVPRLQTAMMSAINEAVSRDLLNTAHFSQSVVVERFNDCAALKINFSSLGQLHEFSHANHSVAIAFINLAETQVSIDTEILVRSYKFTKTEIKIACLLVNGLTVPEMALELVVTGNTIKSHIKHIHQKTGVSSRAKLLRLLLSLSIRV